MHPSASASSEKRRVREEKKERRVRERPAGASLGNGGADPEPPSKRNPIVNLLGAYGTSPAPESDERSAWLDQNLVRIEAEAAAKLPDTATPKQVGEKVKSIAVGWWQQYLKGHRQFLGISKRLERERKLDAWEREHGEQPEA